MKFIALYTLFFTCVGCFVRPRLFMIPRARSEVLPSICLRKTASEIWSILEETRCERERIKLEIVDVVGRQRQCEEGTSLYLALEKKFIELLYLEDNTVLKISQLVDDLISSSKLDRNASLICKTYFKEG
jgi:hypothetical protein